MSKNSAIYLVAFLFFASAIGYLCYAAFSASSVYFLNVAEARQTSPDKLHQARLFGIVSEANLNKSLNSVSFELQDKDDASQIIPVAYTGAVPDTFKSGAEVIVEGGMARSGSFNAKTLMTKCPSKYQKENRKL